MSKKEREICEFEMDLKNFCLCSNQSNDNIIPAYGPGLKTSMDFRGLVWERVWKITYFGLKKGQDLESLVAHPHQEIPGVPPGIQLPRCLFFSSPSFKAEIEDEPCKENYVHFVVIPLNTNWNEYFLLLCFTSVCFNTFEAQKWDRKG